MMYLYYSIIHTHLLCKIVKFLDPFIFGITRKLSVSLLSHFSFSQEVYRKIKYDVLITFTNEKIMR